MRKIYTHRKISDRLYIIYEKYCEECGFSIGLVVGDKKAAVVDSGLGATDDLRRYAETLTDRELICIATHGHPDHAGGAALFDKVYLSRLDDDVLKWALTRERRLSDLGDFSDHDPEILEYAKLHAVDTAGFQYENLTGGMQFDLGGVILEILPMPGHTPGSMAVLNRAEQYIFTGDAVSETLMLTEYDIRYIKESYEALKNMTEICGKFPELQIWAAHYPKPVPLQMAIDLRDCCEDIILGRTEGDERTHFKFAEMNDPDIVLYRHVKRSAAVTYNAAILQSQ